MHVDVALIVRAPHNLALSSAPEDGSRGVEGREQVALPATLLAPPVLVLGQVKRVGLLDARDVRVVGHDEVAVEGRRAADGVDEVRVDVGVRSQVAVARARVGVPPVAVLAEALDDARRAVYDLDLGYARALETGVICVLESSRLA